MADDFNTDLAICRTLTTADLRKLYMSAGILHDSYKEGRMSAERLSNYAVIVLASMTTKHAAECVLIERLKG